MIKLFNTYMFCKKNVKVKIIKLIVFLIIKSFFFASGIYPQSPDFITGKKFYEENKYDTAIMYFDLSIQNDIDYSKAFIYRGICYTNLDSLDKALDDFDTYLLSNPSDVAGILWQGIIYNKQKLFDKALEKFRYLIDNDFLLAYFAMGKCYYDNGEYELAISAYDSAVFYGIEKGESYYYIWMCYLFKNNVDSACKYLGYSRECGEYQAEQLMCEYCDSLQIVTAVTKSYVADGLNYMDMKNYDAAIVKFLTALEVTNNYPDALYLIGSCYYYKGDYDNAVKYITQAIYISPLDEYYVYRGISYYKLMQDSKIKNSEKKQMMYRLYAINDFETYINKDTSYYYGYSYLGWIYFYDYYDMEKSFIMFKKAIKLERDDVDVMVGLLLSSYCLGEEENTKKYYENICQFEPDFRGNKKGLEYLEKERKYSYTDFEKSVFKEMYEKMFSEMKPVQKAKKEIPVNS